MDFARSCSALCEAQGARKTDSQTPYQSGMALTPYRSVAWPPPPTNPSHSRIAPSWKRISPDCRSSTPRAGCRGRRFGSAIACNLGRWSSGRGGRTACTTAFATVSAPRVPGCYSVWLLEVQSGCAGQGAGGHHFQQSMPQAWGLLPTLLFGATIVGYR